MSIEDRVQARISQQTLDEAGKCQRQAELEAIASREAAAIQTEALTLGREAVDALEAFGVAPSREVSFQVSGWKLHTWTIRGPSGWKTGYYANSDEDRWALGVDGAILAVWIHKGSLYRGKFAPVHAVGEPEPDSDGYSCKQTLLRHDGEVALQAYGPEGPYVPRPLKDLLERTVLNLVAAVGH